MFSRNLFYVLSILALQIGMIGQIQAQSLPKNSLYNIKSEWRDQNDQSLQLQKFSGKKIILGMVYTGCAHSCPMTVAKIQDLIKQSGLKDYPVVLASFDSRKDRPKVLKKFMKVRKLSEGQWTMLTADKDAVVRELAVSLGINYKDLGDGDFSHSNILSLVSEEGVVLQTLDGFQANTDSFIKAMVAHEGK